MQAAVVSPTWPIPMTEILMSGEAYRSRSCCIHTTA